MRRLGRMETPGCQSGGCNDPVEHQAWGTGALKVQGSAVPNTLASLLGEVPTEQLHVVGPFLAAVRSPTRPICTTLPLMVKEGDGQ